jgi:hypothetical protein
MAEPNALQAYLRDVQYIHDTGAGVKETSYYPALSNLFNAVGRTLQPHVHCIITLRNQGSGLPDGGLFTPDQALPDPEGTWQSGQVPSRGAIEVKSPIEDVYAVAHSDQVQRYCTRYGQVLVTNLRDFLLVARTPDGECVALERYALAGDEASFWTLDSRRVAQEHGERFTEYLKRVMLHAAPLTAPRDVAWLLASYAREALARTMRSDPGSPRRQHLRCLSQCQRQLVKYSGQCLDLLHRRLPGDQEVALVPRTGRARSRTDRRRGTVRDPNGSPPCCPPPPRPGAHQQLRNDQRRPVSLGGS